MVNLPWREPHLIIHNGYEYKKKGLMSLLSRLNKEPDILREYESVEQLDRGIVERLFEKKASEVGEVHYLPHHPVLSKDKQTTKVLIVYDAFTKGGGGPSLNECLYAEPSLIENVADISIRIRSHRVRIVGDKEMAFLIVSVAEEDRDVLRFLWVDDPLKEKPSVVLLRFTRVVFGLS